MASNRATLAVVASGSAGNGIVPLGWKSSEKVTLADFSKSSKICTSSPFWFFYG
jgi:hypothetical protein